MPRLLKDTVKANKVKIERAALDLFTRQGFHGTTVREIAKKARVSMGNSTSITPPRKTSSSTW